MSLYRQAIPPLTKYLNNLSDLLAKGREFADEKGMKHGEILNYRLAPDMRLLIFQVQNSCNVMKFLPVRLRIADDVYIEDNETTLEQLQTRITKTIDFLKEVDDSRMDGKEDEPLIMDSKTGRYKFESGQEYVSNYVLPYFHFHMGTAYCILRHLGVEIGALDYLGKETFVKA